MLLDHNIAAYKQLCKAMDDCGHAILIQTTGSGKSYVALEYIEDNQLNTLVVVPTHIIGTQWKHKSELITYVCYRTFSKIKNFFEYDLVIFDEAHHIGAPTYEVAFEDFITLGIPYIALTADAVRWSDSARDISKDYFAESTISGLSLEDGISNGILPDIEYTVALYSPSEFVSKYFKHEHISESLLAKLNYSIDNTESIVNIISSKVSKTDTKGIVFVDSIDNMQIAYDIVRKVFGANIFVTDIHSKHSDKYNDEQLKLFKQSNNPSFIIAVNMLNEGIHVEDINTIIMLRRTISPNVYFQQIGRGITVRKNSRIQVFDLVGNKNLLRVVNHKDTYKTLIHSSIAKMFSDQIIIDDRTIDILNVLREIKDSLSGKWQQWEIDKIKSDYPTKGSDIPELKANGRTRAAIISCAQKLRIKYESNDWSEEEDNIIITKYPKLGANIPELLDNGRTQGAIFNRAHRIGVGCDSIYWSEEEDNIIITKYPKLGTNIQELLDKGRTRGAIIARAKTLGVKYDNSNCWSEEDITLLISKYPECGTNIQELLEEGKTKSAIMSKALVLGITNKSRFWSEEDFDILRSEYPKYGPNIPKLLDKGRTKDTIVKQAQKLGIKCESRFWSEEDINTLKQKYPECGGNIPELLEKGKDISSIYRKANSLRLKYSRNKK